MDSISIQGGIPLVGEINISGAKNSALPNMVACLLTDEPVTLNNCPRLSDILTLKKLLQYQGVKCNFQNSTISLQAKSINTTKAPYDLVRTMRASVLVLGPLLARTGQALVSLPGGCTIGTRPIDLHLQALQQMGVEISLEKGYIVAQAKKSKLQGAVIKFRCISVGATANLLMSATLAKGISELHNVAIEPEIIDLGNMLIKMGAKIDGLGTRIITVQGVDKLHGVTHSIISDRIEAGSYAIASAITHGNLQLNNISSKLLPNFLQMLESTGSKITIKENSLIIQGSDEIRPIDITTAAFPGFPTDLQAQFMSLMILSKGKSQMIETMFENRYMHVPELIRMGAKISVSGNRAKITGVDTLLGAEVMATDLRASFSLILAGLVAKGKTTINRVYHLDRGYENIEDKLSKCGAQIQRQS